MHSIHSLAHRAPPATRSRVRWQPYTAFASASSSASSVSSRSPSLSTPATSVSPSPKPTPLCEPERLKAHSSMDSSNPTKNKYATGLVDQAVKSLCEIWRPQDIPTVFMTSSRATVGSCTEIPPPPTSCRRKTPSSPPSPLSSLACSRTAQIALQCEPDLASGFHRSNLVPIKGFVHEVLRRSRTSGSVLQTALCYLEAIRPKVPELVRKEQSGEGTQIQYDSDSRVMPATPAELALEVQLSASCVAADNRPDEDVMDTVRVSFDDIACTATPSSAPEDEEIDTQKSAASASSAPLPSPLLCPRRAFLASLILASKFTQDKCYSNRAWAKLSGLPAREIGRCERALGDALDWRLWVGKTPAASQASSATSPANTKAVVRCQSEGNLALGKSPFLARKEAATNTISPVASRPAYRGLRRSSTLPVDAFASSDRAPPQAHYVAWAGDEQDQSMGSPEEASPSTPSSVYPGSSHYAYPSSPIPPSPGLSYSPSSTESESSSGDQTIQMSTFLDDTTMVQHDTVGIVGCGNEMWEPTLSGVAFEAAMAVPAVGVKFGPAGTASWRWSDPKLEYAKFFTADAAPLEYTAIAVS